MRITIICICLALRGTLWSQTELFTKVQKVAVPVYCTPGIANKARTRGVEIYYTRAGGGDIQWRDAVPGDLQALGEVKSYEHFGAKLNIPIVLKPDFKLFVGYAYQPERYQYRAVGAEIQPFVEGLNNRLLKSNSFTMTASKSLSATNYLLLRGKVGFNGEYDQWINFDKRYQTFNALALLGFKKTEDFEWGVGLYYNKNMRRQLLLPFAILNKNFNDKWGIELAPPVHMLGRYNINPKSILLFGAEYHSRMYSIDSDGFSIASTTPPPIYRMNHNEINAVVTIERQLIPWIWMSVKGGYQFNMGGRFESVSPDNPSYRLRLPNAPFVNMSIFLSPPDHMK